MTPENYAKKESGLIFKDYEIGKGDYPKAGQQVFLLVPFLKIDTCKAVASIQCQNEKKIKKKKEFLTFYCFCSSHL